MCRTRMRLKRFDRWSWTCDASVDSSQLACLFPNEPAAATVSRSCPALIRRAPPDGSAESARLHLRTASQTAFSRPDELAVGLPQGYEPARGDAGRGEAPQRVDISALLRDVVASLDIVAQDRGLEFFGEIDDGLAVNAGGDALVQLFGGTGPRRCGPNRKRGGPGHGLRRHPPRGYKLNRPAACSVRPGTAPPCEVLPVCSATRPMPLGVAGAGRKAPGRTCVADASPFRCRESGWLQAAGGASASGLPGVRSGPPRPRRR